MLDRLLALIAPPTCLACHRRTAAGAPLCAGCRREIGWLAGSCRRCSLPMDCAPCPASAASWDEAWSVAAYDGPARSLVHALKFEALLAAGDAMAAQIVANAPAALLDGVVVPVPADPRRRRARGYDPAEVLARRVAARARLPLDRRLLVPAALERQLGAGRGARLRRARAGVALGHEAPAAIVLVDDVHTTGATLERCARALRGGGALRIVAVTYARTLR